MIRKTLMTLLRRFPTLYAAFRGAYGHQVVSRLPATTPFGFKLAGPPAMERGEFEPEETKQVCAFLREAEVFVNVGANVGYYVCHARQLGISVLAIEPLDQNVQILQRNLLANGWNDVEVHPVALGNHVGLEKLYGGGTAASLVAGWAGANAAHYRVVPVTTLDHLLGDRFAEKRLLILIDVEGFELNVLRGASRQLARRPAPVWFVEICIDEHQPQANEINPNLQEIFELFWLHGYAAEKAGCESGAVTAENVRAWTVGHNLPGTHNFVFRAIEN